MDGTMVRALASHQCSPGSMGLVCCWFLPCFDGLLPGSPVFLPLKIPTSLNSNSNMIEDLHEDQLTLIGLSLQILQFITFIYHHLN